MPRFEDVKSKCCVYLLQRYLGDFFFEKLDPEQLSVNLSDGTCSLRDIRLDVMALNHLADIHNFPLEFVDGFIENVRISVPYISLMSESSNVEVTSLRITMQPKARHASATSLLESMWSSMTSSMMSSMSLAEDCVRRNPPTDSQTYPAVEMFAQAIESLVNRVRVKFVDTIFQVEHFPLDSPFGVGLLFHIDLITYSDVSANDPAKEEATNFSKQDEKKAYMEQSHSARTIRFEGVSVSTVEISSKGRTVPQKPTDMDSEKNLSGDERINADARTDINGEDNKRQYCSNEERSIIKCGKFDGNVDLVVMLKKSEEMDGPKVSIQFNMGPLLLFLSPRQFHLLLELAYGLCGPDTEDHSDVIATKCVGKPMSNTDYERIEKDLQQQLTNPTHFNALTYPGTHGWATGTLDGSDVDENFKPVGVGYAGDFFEGVGSGTSMMGSSMSSSITSMTTDVTSRTRKKMNRIDRDPTAEISHFEIHLISLAVVLLHEDLLIESSETQFLAASSVAQMQATVDKFFSKSTFLSNDLKDVHTSLDKACRLNHLRLLATTIHVEADEKTTSSAFSDSGYLEATSLELSECLYNAKNARIEHIPIVTFGEMKPVQSESTATARPSLKLVFKRLDKTCGNFFKSGPKTDFNFTLNQCTVELDVTIIDRIAALLHPQPIIAVNRVHVNADSRESKVDLRVTAPLLTVKLRFPIPDFRPPHDRDKRPWWERHVESDFLLVGLSNAVFQTMIDTRQEVQEFSVHCKSLTVSYQESANSDPMPVAKAGFEETPLASLRDIMTECRVNVKLFPPAKYGLDELQKTPEPITTSIAGVLLEMHNPKGPFSSKKIIYESDTPHPDKQKDDAKELLVPGDKQEVDNFIKTATASARIRIDVFLALVSMQLKDKGVYETIYNRINNGLLLWEPSAPSLRATTPVYDSLNYAPLRNIDNDDRDVYRLCKSGIHHSSDSDSEENSDDSATIFYSTYGSRMKVPQKQTLNQSNEESYIALNIQINHGSLCMFPFAKDTSGKNNIPNQQGEFLVNIEDARIFFVGNYKGDPDLSFVCMELHNGQLYHCDIMSTPSHTPPLKDIGATPGKHLHPTIYSSENGMLAASKDRGSNREMVTVCIKIKASHETHHVKNVSISAGFNKVTLRHRMCNEPNSWISQFIDFFNVKDVTIPGYKQKEILTELSLHCWDSAIDYRPRYLPIRSAITLGSFSISSHLSAEINSSTLRFIAEECGLFLSQKSATKNGQPYSGPVDLRRDYINVVDLGVFEISLKTSDKKNVDTPHFDLRASNNIIHIRTCADTAKALTQLIKYLANYGDLVPPEGSGSAFSSPRHVSEQELISVEPQEIVNVSESQHRQIHDLIEDALEDVDDRKTRAKSDLYTYNGTKMFYFPDEKNPIQDSAKPLPQVTTELGHVVFQPDSGGSEDDFCFIDEEPGYNIFPKNGVPEIRWLTNESIKIDENHFIVPSEKSDPLKTPKNFPTPTRKYTLCEMSVVWHMYGGDDFGPTEVAKKKTVNFADARLKDSVAYSNVQKDKVVIESEKGRKRNWLTKGGPNRDHAVLMELQLNKIRFQHEVYPDASSKASRQVLIVSEVEVRDRLKSSQLNKFLYQYVSRDRPKRSNANMLLIKLVHVRPDPQLRSQECCLKISMLPLRFNIDQDALQFLISFFTALGSDMKDDEVLASGSKHSTPIHQPPVMTVCDDNEERLKEQVKKIVDENLLILLEDNKIDEEEEEEEEPQLTSGGNEDSPIYFRKVVFSPDVPIRLDYHGKHFDLRTHGAIQGVLMGLAQLNCSELRLKRITHRHGLLGLEKLLMFFFREWINDIKKNQIPSLLVGVGPLHSFVQLFLGIRDLFCLPFEQYKKDGRFFRGLHRGANSFTTSTAMAALELTTRLIHLIQITAETAFDMLTPGPSVRINPKTKSRRKRYRQPKDIREGVTNAYKLVKEGFEETADNILQVASHEHEHKGYSGAVGGVIRQIPPTIIKPIIIASEATNNVLGGVRCQLVPDARKEAHEKWRNDETYDSFE